MSSTTTSQQQQSVQHRRIVSPLSLVLVFLMSLVVSVNGFAAPTPKATKSGIKYIDLEVGNGDSPGKSDFVTVHYEGRLKKTGKIFGATRGGKGDFRNEINKGTPLSFKFGRDEVIPGWEEGMASMKVGGKRQLTVPSEMAYGDEGSPDGLIPKNADLVFDVELVAIVGDMNLVGSMGKGFQFAIGLILVNGLTAYVTGHELREYVNGSLN